MDPLQLPSLEELKEIHGTPKPARELTPAELKQAKADRAARPKHLETKKKSEALCKRQLEKWGATVAKARDDERVIKGVGHVRISTDVDFVGYIPLIPPGGMNVVSVPLKVESKGATLKGVNAKYHEDGTVSYQLRGSLPLKNISDKERSYLRRHRLAGGLSAVHVAWWYEGKCDVCLFIQWKDWGKIERELLLKAVHDKRFKGASIRWHADQDIIEKYAVMKLSGRWELHEDHWLREHLPQSGEQPLMF